MKLKIGKKTGLKYFSYEDIRSWEPCYDPSRYISKNWRGTALDILKRDDIPFADRLWCVLHSEVVSERVVRLFAVWSARQVQHLMSDPRSLAALDVAERFANGMATREQLAAAWAAAWDASWDAAARASAWAAAWDASWDADDAARAAAWAAAWDAARAAARAANDAARAADDDADDAARAAAWAADDTAWAAKKDKLIEMILAEAKERRK